VDTLGKAYMGVLMAKRKRRSFTPEFKSETVRLVLDGGKSIPEVARELDLTESALRLWREQGSPDRAGDPKKRSGASAPPVDRETLAALTASPLERKGRQLTGALSPIKTMVWGWLRTCEW
jgi:transposase